MKLIAIVAQNPKTEENIECPLIGTRSYTVLKRWLDEAGISEENVAFFNSVDTIGHITKSQAINEAIRSKTLAMKLSGYKYVVSLGKLAGDLVRGSKMNHPYEMAMLHSTHFNIPHPSGLNRQLNDPEAHYIAVQTLKCAYQMALNEVEATDGAE